MRIVLAHGVLGFGRMLEGPTLIHYFNGVAAHLERHRHEVLEPQVNPVGSIAQRGDQLAAAVSARFPSGEKVHILAHSMGGLDSRHAITNVPGFSERVATLVTIGTPHRGSPVADAIADRTDPLFKDIPPVVAEQLLLNAGALQNLTTGFCRQFDENTHDVPGVRYVEVAGDASRGGHELFLLRLAAAIGRIKGEVNDGVVTKPSALRGRGQQVEDWPVDHFGEIGWSLTSPLPILVEPVLHRPAHFARYDAIVGAL